MYLNNVHRCYWNAHFCCFRKYCSALFVLRHHQFFFCYSPVHLNKTSFSFVPLQYFLLHNKPPNRNPAVLVVCTSSKFTQYCRRSWSAELFHTDHDQEEKKTRETGYCLVENKKNITIIPKQCLFFIIHTKLQLGIQMFFLKLKWYHLATIVHNVRALP